MFLFVVGPCPYYHVTATTILGLGILPLTPSSTILAYASRCSCIQRMAEVWPGYHISRPWERVYKSVNMTAWPRAIVRGRHILLHIANPEQ